MCLCVEELLSLIFKKLIWQMTFVYENFRCQCGRSRAGHIGHDVGECMVDGVQSGISDFRYGNKAEGDKIKWNPKKHLGKKTTNAYGDVFLHAAGKKSNAKVCIR